MTGPRRRVLFIAAGVLVVAAVAAEALSRRSLMRRYRNAVEAQQRLEHRLQDVLAAHEGLQRQLSDEQRRSTDLAAALAAAHTELQQATGRLSEESRNVKDLQVRLSAMQRQMDQLQGELSLTLQQAAPRAAAPNKPSGPVALERIIVSNATTAGGLRGRVLSIHPEWNFVVIDLGWSAVRIGDTVSVFRNDQLLAKARVDRVQEGVCAATILPQWPITDLRINDAVQLL